ncbi:MAG: hypothetical protein Q8S39_13400, partial [Ignavibacteria bacterium]|nr:hypothetical protein [Ignavibacteria bacterium]
QETTGNVYSVSAGFGYRLSNSVLLGLIFSHYFGKINSMIRGENHNIDSDKWVSMESSLSGVNFKCGLIFSNRNWSAGVTLETPFEMKVKTSNQISTHQLYKYLLPDYDETNWNQPFVLAAGVSYCGINNLLFEADYEIRKYKSSVVQINLYEFGGNPVWQNVSTLRFGLEYKPDDWKLPVKLGYAIMPQLYYSNNSVGFGNIISSYNNTDRNKRYAYTVGTTFQFNKLLLDLCINYSTLKWNRTLFASVKVVDDFSENTTTLSIRLECSI